MFGAMLGAMGGMGGMGRMGGMGGMPGVRMGDHFGHLGKRSKHAEPLKREIEIPLEQLYTGTTKKLKITRKIY